MKDEPMSIPELMQYGLTDDMTKEDIEYIEAEIKERHRLASLDVYDQTNKDYNYDSD